MIDLQGKIVMVTGASGGIGGASAKLLAEAGATVVLSGRDREKLESLAGEIRYVSSKAYVVPFDVCVGEEVKAAFSSLPQLTGGLDFFIAAAGIMREAPLAMTSSDVASELYWVNVAGTYTCCQYASRLISRKPEGGIVTFSSVVGEQGARGQSAYCASKAAVSGLTKSLAKELACSKIRVNCIAPGFIDTGLTSGYDEGQKTDLLKSIALGRIGMPIDVARVVLFLCSPLAEYMTGQVLGVDGGIVI